MNDERNEDIVTVSSKKEKKICVTSVRVLIMEVIGKGFAIESSDKMYNHKANKK